MKWHIIPKLYKDCKSEQLCGSEAYKEQVKQIMNWNFQEPSVMSLLSSSNGIGKTHLAWCLVKKFMFQEIMSNHYEFISNNRQDYTRFFWKEYEILNAIKSTYDESGRLNEEHMKKIFINKRLLVIDDIFRTKSNDWATGIMFEIIDMRVDDKLPTIITSNFSLEQIGMISSALSSRINNACCFEFGVIEDQRGLK